MQAPFLTLPDVRYKASFISATREFLQVDGRRPPWKFDKLATDFAEYVKTVRADRDDPLPGRVPQTVYWLIAEGVFAGRVSIRHHLIPALERFGGHIGYEIRPSMRRRGYGRLQCKLVLAEARKMGLKRVLITCDDDNIGSIKIIEANGGVLQDKLDNKRRSLTRRYWVDLA